MTLFVSDIINSRSSSVTGNPAASSSLQWKRNGEPIENAVASQYNVVAEDEGKIISVTQTFTSFAGTSVKTSASLGPVLPNPSTLYTQSEQGVWYDPGDFNRYMQTGEELVMNGTFDNGTVGWTSSNAIITNAGGFGRVTSTIVGLGARVGIQTITGLTIGQTYEVTGFATGSGGSGVKNTKLEVRQTTGSLTQSNAVDNPTVATLLRLIFTATETSHGIWLRFDITTGGDTTSYVEFDNISIKELSLITTASLFQDSTGTTRVTSVEQPVGLMLDKRLGLINGPELLSTGVVITSGTGSASYDTSTGVGSATRVDVSNIGYVRFAVSANTFHIVSITNTGTVELSVRDSAGIALTGSLAAGATLAARLNPGTGAQFRVQANVNGSTINFTVNSIKELPGNHAFQSTAIDRPILRNRYNLLTKTEQFDDAVWFKSDDVVTRNATLAPDGKLSAEMNTEGSTGAALLQQSVSVQTGVSYRCSFFVKRGSVSIMRILAFSIANPGNQCRFWVDLTTGTIPAAGQPNTIGNGFTISNAAIEQAEQGFFKIAFTFSSSLVNDIRVGLCSAVSAGSTVKAFGSTYYPWGASLVPVDQSYLPYQWVDTATVYDSDTAKFPLYLACNGTNTWMQTANIDFTSTDKVTVFAGVRKLSEGATAAVVELSANSSSTPSAFGLFTPTGNSVNSFNWQGRGVSGFLNNSVANSLVAPVTGILTTYTNIASNSSTIRLNAVALQNVTAPLGGGNYGNYPLYLFRRGGTTLPFNGNFYGLIIRGTLTSQAQIELTERWMAKRTSVALP